MPLTPPVEREPLHRRAIEINGYRRADGLYDIEAHLVDTKSYPFINHDRGEITPGVPLHGMLARMTVDTDMMITRFEAVTEFGPYTICPSAAPNFERLAGLKIGRGFLKACNERVGGVHGCTHLRELLGQLGTVAFQTLFSARHTKRQEPNATDANATETAGMPAARPMMLGTCLAYAPDSPVVKRQWPAFYTGADGVGAAEVGASDVPA